MATDATGSPTTPDALPKLNTSVDSPSGLGMNAMMDATQTALSNRVSIPAALAAAEVPVWNGAAWVRSSVTNIGPTSLGSGTPDTTKFLRGDGAWQVPGLAVIADLTLGGAQASFDTNTILGGNLPTTFSHLKLVLYAREDGAVGIDACSMRFNNDATAIYDYEYVRGSGGGTTANAETFAATSAQIGLLSGTTGGANLFSSTDVMIPHYNGALNNKSFTSLSTAKIGVAAGNMYVENVGGYWRSNAAITRITVLPGTGNFAAGTRFTLYGLA